MKLNDTDTELLKAYIIKKLDREASEVDADVLADYIHALLSTEEELLDEAGCIENLRDFLGERSEAFVRELFVAISTRAYDPFNVQSEPSLPTSLHPPQHASRRSINLSRGGGTSRKRLYRDWDRDETHNGSYTAADSPVKQVRRGRGARNQYLSTMLLPPPGMPPFDSNNPLASFIAMQQIMGLLPPDFPGVPAPLATDRSNSQYRFAQRCRDYDNKGYCARGVDCPFEHGNDFMVTGEGHNMANAMLNSVRPARTGVVCTTAGSRGRGVRSKGYGRGGGRGAKRADFSLTGPNFDKSNTTIVVEQIPKDKHNEQAMREFFATFGRIEEISLQPFKRLAIIKYDTFGAAKAAYDSPKSVFDNRFVKIYWYKSDDCLPKPPGNEKATQNMSEDVHMRDDEPELDFAEVAAIQAEAQRRHEQKKKEIEDARKRKEATDAQLKKIEAEKKIMAERLAKMQGKQIEEVPKTNGMEDSAKTRELKAQLAKLEAEAKDLGIDPNAASNSWNGYTYTPRGRGGFRSGFRGGRPRGRSAYNPSYRGGWASLVPRGSAVKRLDNRPKTVCVTFTEGTYGDHQEALRSWLLFNGIESASLDKHPVRGNAALVAFPERYQAENLMATTTTPDFPLAGKSELSWYKSETPTDGILDSHINTDVSAELERGDDDVRFSGDPEEPQSSRDLDAYDVADEDDRWG